MENVNSLLTLNWHRIAKTRSLALEGAFFLSHIYGMKERL